GDGLSGGWVGGPYLVTGLHRADGFRGAVGQEDRCCGGEAFPACFCGCVPAPVLVVGAGLADEVAGVVVSLGDSGSGDGGAGGDEGGAGDVGGYADDGA